MHVSQHTEPLLHGPSDPPRCEYFAAELCRSCAFIETPIQRQLETKMARCRELLPGVPERSWLPAVAGGVAGFRNRAKLVVGGTRGEVTLGILDRGGDGIDLSDCLIHEDGIREVIPVIARLLNDTGLEPYSVPRRRGELKYVHITISPAGELMLRFVVRSEDAWHVLRKRTDTIRDAVPHATVISVNILPQHVAMLEGEREELLHGSSLAMALGDGSREVTLHLRPQSFFQTNTRVALALYKQAALWVDTVDPASLWDLYCGVGGFALLTAGSAHRRVLGVELSERAIASAKRSGEQMAAHDGADKTPVPEFYAADATEFALAAEPHVLPELVIVNPPRRGIGEALAGWIESSPIRHVIYSSCNPESLARDLERMPSLRVSEARLFDMFPHTNHLEVAVLLERK